MWRRSKRPPFDHSVGRDPIITCMDSEIRIEYLRDPDSSREYQSIESLILFRDQIPQILRGLMIHPESISDFIARITSGVEFDIVDRSFSESLRVYTKMARHRMRKPEQPSTIKKLFGEMDMHTRVFMAKV